MQNRPELSSSDRLRRSALRLLRAGCPDEADLLNNAASKIDTGETDIDLAAALMECAALADDDGLLLVICAKSPYAS